MSIASTVRLLLRHWLLLLLTTLVVGAGVYALSTTRPAKYTATASEYVTLTTSASPAELAQGGSYVLDQMPSFGQLATSPTVLNPVIDTLGLQTTVKDLSRNVRVSTPRNTAVMSINVTSTDPQRAAAIANAIGTQLTSAVDTLGPKQPNGRALVRVQSIQTALPPTVQSSPDTRRNTALGLLIGLLLGCTFVVGRASLREDGGRTDGSRADEGRTGGEASAREQEAAGERVPAGASAYVPARAAGPDGA